MASLKFDFFKTGTTKSNHVGSVEWDPATDSVAEIETRKNTVLEYAKDKSVVVSVNGAEAAWVIGQPKRRGRQVTADPEVVKAVHELYVNHEVPTGRIPFQLFDRIKDADGNGLEIKEGIVRSILFQKRGTDVEGLDELRKKALAKIDLVAKVGRRKYDEKDRAEWVRMHVEEDLSGSAIAKKLKINSSIVNAELRKQGVQRNSR